MAKRAAIDYTLMDPTVPQPRPGVTMSNANEPPADGLHPSPNESGRPVVTGLDLRILRALRRIIRAVDIHSRKLASACNITTPQLVTLLWIVEANSPTPSDIARQIHLSNSTVVGILDRLEAKGLIRRERSTGDRRLVYVCATDAGRELARTAPSPLQDVFAEAIHKLPASEQATIAQSLDRIVELMEARDIDAAPLLDSGEINRVAPPPVQA